MKKLWLLAILITIIFCLWIAGNVRGEEIDDLVPYVIACESSGNAYAISEDDCIGLMQISKWVLTEYNQYRKKEGWRQFFPKGIHYETYIEIYYTGDLIKADLFNARINKAIGTWYLRRLKEHYLQEDYTIERMLAAYNGGITRLRRLLRQGKDWQDMPKESVNYVKKVLKLYKKGLD